jgi:YD repeat-containing protein
MNDRYGNSLTLTRDSASGTLTKVTTQNGRFVSFTYDGNARVLQTQDNLGRTTSYAYDEGGRLIRVTDPSGAATTYTYDANDQMLTIIDSRSNVVLTNQYDSEGRIVFQTLADSSTFASSSRPSTTTPGNPVPDC